MQLRETARCLVHGAAHFQHSLGLLPIAVFLSFRSFGVKDPQVGTSQPPTSKRCLDTQTILKVIVPAGSRTKQAHDALVVRDKREQPNTQMFLELTAYSRFLVGLCLYMRPVGVFFCVSPTLGVPGAPLRTYPMR